MSGSSSNYNYNSYSEENSNKVAYSASHASAFFGTPRARTRFNETAAAILAANPYSPFETVAGNDGPGVYGPHQDGYVFWVAGKEDKAEDDLKRAWPKFAKKMNKALPGLGLPKKLRGVVAGMKGGRRVTRKARRHQRKRRTQSWR